jgi:tRNA(His) guanylyltransferase
MMQDPLGDRMKANYESRTKFFLPRRTYMILRLDGRCFSSYTRGLKRPFDENFAHVMDLTAERLCEGIGGAVMAYTQSDEISILMQDFESENTQPWFGGNIQKIVSIAAGMASVHFHGVTKSEGATMGHTFDARVFTIADQIEVANYFIWRQRDCVKNSITMAAQTVFSDSELHGKNGGERQDMLFSKDINWNNYPAGFKRGRVCVKEIRETFGGGTWTRWSTSPAPHFTCNDGDFLALTIPAMPALKET